MVEILCPHCDEEIELDDDAQGEFSCPYCDGEFESPISAKIFDYSNGKLDYQDVEEEDEDDDDEQDE